MGSLEGTLLGTPNIRTLVGIFLLYTYYILGVPGLGFPVESLYSFLGGSRHVGHFVSLLAELV